jgi:hypothetical protein
MEAETQEDTHFILALIAGLCQFEDRDELMMAVLVEQLQARQKMLETGHQTNNPQLLIRGRCGIILW